MIVCTSKRCTWTLYSRALVRVLRYEIRFDRRMMVPTQSNGRGYCALEGGGRIEISFEQSTKAVPQSNARKVQWMDSFNGICLPKAMRVDFSSRETDVPIVRPLQWRDEFVPAVSDELRYSIGLIKAMPVDMTLIEDYNSETRERIMWNFVQLRDVCNGEDDEETRDNLSLDAIPFDLYSQSFKHGISLSSIFQ